MVRYLAGDAFKAEDYKKAEALYKWLFVSMQEIYAFYGQEAIDVLKDVADVAICHGRLAEATKTSLRIRDIELGLGLKQSDPKVLKTAEQIASLFSSRGLYDEASKSTARSLQSTDYRRNARRNIESERNRGGCLVSERQKRQEGIDDR